MGLNPDVRTFFSAELIRFKEEMIFTKDHRRLFTGHVVATENTSHFFLVLMSRLMVRVCRSLNSAENHLTTGHDTSLDMLNAVTLSIRNKLSKIVLKLDLAARAHSYEFRMVLQKPCVSSV